MGCWCLRQRDSLLHHSASPEFIFFSLNKGYSLRQTYMRSQKVSTNIKKIELFHRFFKYMEQNQKSSTKETLQIIYIQGDWIACFWMKTLKKIRRKKLKYLETCELETSKYTKIYKLQKKQLRSSFSAIKGRYQINNLTMNHKELEK